MQALDSSEIRSSFRNCSKGVATRLPLPGTLPSTAWGSLDYLGWSDPGAPNAAYLVAPWRGGTVGLVLRLSSDGPATRRENMCSLCTTVHSGTDVALMVAARPGAAGRNGNTVGTYLCRDLGCSLYARRLKKPARVQPAETLSEERRVARLQENLDQFIRRVLTP